MILKDILRSTAQAKRYIDKYSSLMLNCDMKRRSVLRFLIILLGLYFIFRILTSNLFVTNHLDPDNLLNNKQVSSEKLYEESWKMIKKHYIDSSYNSQNWDRWKEHYKDKIKTDDEIEYPDSKIVIG
jgi:hypothetical protein